MNKRTNHFDYVIYVVLLVSFMNKKNGNHKGFFFFFKKREKSSELAPPRRKGQRRASFNCVTLPGLLHTWVSVPLCSCLRFLDTYGDMKISIRFWGTISFSLIET